MPIRCASSQLSITDDTQDSVFLAIRQLLGRLKMVRHRSCESYIWWLLKALELRIVTRRRKSADTDEGNLIIQTHWVPLSSRTVCYGSFDVNLKHLDTMSTHRSLEMPNLTFICMIDR